jgi:hypothetical protein
MPSRLFYTRANNLVRVTINHTSIEANLISLEIIVLLQTNWIQQKGPHPYFCVHTVQ